jgi:hypothetical protein
MKQWRFVMPAAQDKIRVGFRIIEVGLGSGDGKLRIFQPKNEAWKGLTAEAIEGRYRVHHLRDPVEGLLEEYDPKDDIPRYTFKYPVPKTDSSIVILYFMRFPNESNRPPPMTTPDMPPQVPVSQPSPEFIRQMITTFTLDVKTGNANLFQFTQQPQNNN